MRVNPNIWVLSMSVFYINAFVTNVSGQFVKVKVIDKSIKKDIESLGFKFDTASSEFALLASSHKEKAKIFCELEKIGVCFSAGKEWSPSELFEYYRDIGLLNGTYKRISWRKRSEPVVSIE